MKQLLLAALLLLPAAAAAQPATCYNDKISSITTSGRLMRMQTGLVFLVYPGQNTRSIFWEPLDKVRICLTGGSSFKITGPKNQTVDALRQY